MTNAQWRHYEIEPEPGIAATVLFDGNRIDRILVAMKVLSDEAGNWSERIEHERKERHDSWLRTQLGDPPYAFSWGEVASEFDAKGCASEIIVVYDR